MNKKYIVRFYDKERTVCVVASKKKRGGRSDRDGQSSSSRLMPPGLLGWMPRSARWDISIELVRNSVRD